MKEDTKGYVLNVLTDLEEMEAFTICRDIGVQSLQARLEVLKVTELRRLNETLSSIDNTLSHIYGQL